MRPIATDVTGSVVCVSVCLCVGHTDGRTNMTSQWRCRFGGLLLSVQAIHSRKGWQVGNAAFCQITLDTYSL